MSTPSYLTGPCLLRRGGVSIFFESGLKVATKSKSAEVKSDLHGGKIDEYLVSRMITLSGKPVDAIANLSAFFGLTNANVGESIFKGTARTITSISLANPGVATFAAPHNLGAVGTTITGAAAGVAGGILPTTVNGTLTLTVLTSTTASIGVNVTAAGTGGTFTPEAEPLQIVSKNDAAIYTYSRGGILKCPNVHLGAGKGFFSGDLQLACLGSLTKTQVSPTYWKSAVSTAFADTTFDETKIRRYRYTAAYGAAPYDAMTAQGGFDVMIDNTTVEIPDDNFGVGDIILSGVTAGCKFTPSNLTEAQVDTLLNLQDTTAILPGDSFAKLGTTNLVISGTDAVGSFTATLLGAGFKDSQLEYAVGKLRTGEIMAMTRRTWTAGAANALFTFVAT